MSQNIQKQMKRLKVVSSQYNWKVQHFHYATGVGASKKAVSGFRQY